VKHSLINCADAGINLLICQCGTELHPDNVMSRHSIREAWNTHLDTVASEKPA
jgi:hypothetical protein